MLYKVTPMMAPPEKKAKPQLDPDAPKEPRKRRKSAVYDADGNEVLITMMCLKCKSMKPLLMFGLRKMADGAIRNQPWCRTCRSGASSKKPKSETTDTTVETPAQAEAVHTDAPMAEVAVTPVETPPSAQVHTEAKSEPSLPLPEAAEPIAP